MLRRLTILSVLLLASIASAAISRRWPLYPAGSTGDTSATFLYAVDSGSISTGGLSTTATPANQLNCVPWVPSVGISSATKIAAQETAGAASQQCGVCIYNATGTSLLVDGGGISCSYAGSPLLLSKTGLNGGSGVSLSQGTSYRLCWTSTNPTSTITFQGQRSLVQDVVNASGTATMGTGTASAGSGACPATTPTLTAFTGCGTPCTIVSPMVLLSAE
jgi:hypothetical protein